LLSWQNFVLVCIQNPTNRFAPSWPQIYDQVLWPRIINNYLVQRTKEPEADIIRRVTPSHESDDDCAWHFPVSNANGICIWMASLTSVPSYATQFECCTSSGGSSLAKKGREMWVKFCSISHIPDYGLTVYNALATRVYANYVWKKWVKCIIEKLNMLMENAFCLLGLKLSVLIEHNRNSKRSWIHKLFLINFCQIKYNG